MGVPVRGQPLVARAFLLALVGLACCGAVAWAQSREAGGGYEASATVPVAGADQAAARDKALAQALRDIVQSAVTGLLGEDEAASRQAQIERAILARSRSFVTGYQVIDEGPEAGAYRVAVQAHVAADALRRAVEAMDAAGSSSAAGGEATDGATAAESSADVFLRGTVTAVRYRAIRGFLERQVPGVRTVSVQSLEPGAIGLRVRGAFPAHGLSGYLSQADFGSFRLAVTPAEVGPDLEVVVQDAEAPR